MKTKLFTLFLALVASVGTMFASDIQVNGIWYNFDWRTETATVTFEGSSGFTYPNEYTGEVVIPAFVTYEGTTYSVTSIGSSAFSGCSSLTSVTIPNSVTSIGGSAFYECSNLTSVTIGNSVTSIGSSAFYRCSSLTSVTIPNSVTSIGRDAFGYCSGLTSPIYNAHVFAYMPTSYSGAYTIPEGIESIAGHAFYECRSLTSVTIPNSVTSIGWAAFSNCSGLTSVTIPNSVTSIEEWAFSDCSGLTSVTIESEIPPTLGGGVFSSRNNTYPFYVPCNAVNAYKSATYWIYVAERIHGICASSITVRLDPSSCPNWSTVRLWAWTAEGDLFNSWPGQAVGRDSDGWYYYIFDTDITSVNIIWNNGTDQTVNIDGVTSSTCYALNSTTGTTITVSVVDCQKSQGVDDVQSDDEQCTKVLRNGQILIFRGEKTYTLQGQEVK